MNSYLYLICLKIVYTIISTPACARRMMHKMPLPQPHTSGVRELSHEPLNNK